ncbi:putative abnormal spindle-like microcephaly-associated protein-like isoform X1 [Apostichopus japonicus]|uniref:Putative abnormal spindle-like microcephaly-associated protein-like isoform X1 n=1 Tax=Stichopus japonicus TaxID=307972 RepID=A0A2G8K6J3_STIJA|nr:putative abnormal spindle-like microcephaly-associated protein-like isoform X1 [Apostichopus japonicus]
MDEDVDIGGGGGGGGGGGIGQDLMEDDILNEFRGAESKVEEEEDENVRPVRVEEGDEEESDVVKAETVEDTVVGIETLSTESEVMESTDSCDVYHGVEGMKGIVNELSGGKLEVIESAERIGENHSEDEAGDTVRASSYSPTDGEVESASPLEDATLDVDESKITDDDVGVRGQHHETTILDKVPAREEEKQGLMFISLDHDTSSRSKKRTSDPDDTGVTAVKKPKTSNSSGTTANKPNKGRKSGSLSLNRTVALRRAAAMNSSVTGGSRTKPKTRKAMKGVPMAKLNLLKPGKTALPRHPMPFAAKNMFYDERWIDKQERGFVQWLNYILTPEEEGALNPTIKGKKIEASALAVSSSSTTIKPAPTKEVLSMRAYTARRRLNQLRRGACMLFQSEPVVRVIQKLEAQVEIGRMTVRTDRKIHADLGMKQNILMMILSYNPLWLRIGLETIYGELLPIEDNSDVIGLSRFIVTRLLGNPDIAEQYSHPTVPGLFGPGYELTLAKFTLKKFLLLVFFLDKAKLTRLIDHNPCLFCKDAQYKSSRDLLLEFSRHYLKGEGDITRHLNYIGFSVTHVQKAIDEFDYAVLNLAKDLRDGIRLVRVTELLTKNWLLSHELRCPAISRLQKVHNVQVALDALTSSAESSVGGVEAKAIVDGHREKTLQLLWSIIFAFKVETMLDEAQLKEETVFLWNNLKLRQKLDAVKMPAQKKTKRPDVTDVYLRVTS